MEGRRVNHYAVESVESLDFGSGSLTEPYLSTFSLLEIFYKILDYFGVIYSSRGNPK